MAQSQPGPNTRPIGTSSASGPGDPPGSTAGVGLFEGTVRAYRLDGPGAVPLSDLGVEIGAGPVAPGELLEIALYPQMLIDDAGIPDRSSTLLGLTLLHDGGAEAGAVVLEDHNGHDLAAAPLDRPRHLAATALVPDQWNLWRIDLADLAGRPLADIALRSYADHGTGWLQVRRTAAPSRAVPDDAAQDGPGRDVVDLVDTRRGTHSGHGFSRGNTFPATCLPHGMNFLTPVTDARTRRWLYRWHGDPTPRLQGLGISHQPSPWIGDRGAVHLMPYTGTAVLDPVARSLGFRHEDETAHPDRYAVRLENGIEVEMTPTSRAAVFRIHLPAAGGVTLDQPFDGALSVHHDHGLLAATGLTFHGWAPGNVDRPSQPAPVRVFFAGAVPTAQGWEPAREADGEPRSQAAHVSLPAGDHEVRLATSFISVEQARHNLALETAGRTFEDLRTEAHETWLGELSRLELDGAPANRRATAYSSLYRLLCYPNEAHENRGTHEAPDIVHASPVAEPAHEHTDTTTGCLVLPGELYVNNGYWDTYRTCWPAFDLLMPERSGRLLDGMLQLYRDSGWMGRWSAPGFVNCMVGTSSDVVFADAAAHGVAFDEETAYLSGLRNALTPPESDVVGRRRQGTLRFRDWVDTSVPEGLSWCLEGAINDAGLARWAATRAQAATRVGTDPQAASDLRAEAVYLRNRAMTWRHLIQPGSGFLVGRHRDGTWRARPEEITPRVWGGDYTETNGWGMAFSAVHDATHLTAALGGPQGLGERLDAYFADPETASWEQRGTYDEILHEMVEARAIGMGQFALSNQPAHHVPFMYLYSDRPDRAGDVLAESFDRLFDGAEIGQGWPGDEDNGEFSAWWLFVAMGLYPLDVGSGRMVLAPPQLPAVAWTRADGTRLEVRTAGSGRYIGSVSVNGETWTSPVLDVAHLHDTCQVVVTLSDRPRHWGGGLPPDWLAGAVYRSDAASDGTLRATTPGAGALIDDDGDTTVTLEAGAVVEVELASPRGASVHTLTAAVPGDLEVVTQVRRAGRWGSPHPRAVAFRWPGETRVLELPGDRALRAEDSASTPATGDVEAVRWTFPEGADLRQVEIL